MPLRRKRTRSTDAIVISSSSESSQASEDSATESDANSSSKYGQCAAGSNMSERQTRKINSGSFGMFNRPTLSGGLKKRKRVQGPNDRKQSPLNRGSETKGHDASQAFGADSNEDHGSSLFIPESRFYRNAVLKNKEPEIDQQLYSDMTAERIQQVKEYLRIAEFLQQAVQDLQAAETALSEVAAEQTNLSWKHANIGATTEDKISDVIRERDEIIRTAREHANSETEKLRARVTFKRAKYEGEMRECDGRKTAMEECIALTKGEVDQATETKRKLEQQGGFELCSDVRDVQARCRARGSE